MHNYGYWVESNHSLDKQIYYLELVTNRGVLTNRFVFKTMLLWPTGVFRITSDKQHFFNLGQNDVFCLIITKLLEQINIKTTDVQNTAVQIFKCWKKPIEYVCLLENSFQSNLITLVTPGTFILKNQSLIKQDGINFTHHCYFNSYIDINVSIL